MAEEDNEPQDIEEQDNQPDTLDSSPQNEQQSGGAKKKPITEQINNKIHNMRKAGEAITSGGIPTKRAKKMAKSYNDPYARHRANESKIKSAINTTEPVAKPNALKLQVRKAAFDTMAKANKKVLDNPAVSGPNAKELVAHEALKVADKLDNILNRQASKMKREQRLIKQQEAIAKAGPYGRLVAFFWGCKNWCLGHAMIICTVTGGLGYVVLKLTGAI